MKIVKKGVTYGEKNAQKVAAVSEALYGALVDGTLSLVDRTAQEFLIENSSHIFAIAPEVEGSRIAVNFYFPKPLNYKGRLVKSLALDGAFTSEESRAAKSAGLLGRINAAIKGRDLAIKEAQRSK